MFCPVDQLFSHIRDHNTPAFLYGSDKITWGNFSAHVTKFSEQLRASPQKEFLLYCHDTFLFAVGFFALLQAEKTIILPQNIQPQTLQELAGNNGGLISDAEINNCTVPVINIEYIPDLAQENSATPTELIQPTSDIIFSTSGSTGQPKKISKTLRQLTEEINELQALWENLPQNTLLVSTVSHQHIYGLLFRLLWPLCRGDLINSSLTFSPEALIDLAKISENIVLISSPAFLKRITENAGIHSFPQNICRIFSSGGVLESATAEQINNIFNHFPYEIFGSTETGGIAHRTQEKSDIWQAFPKVEIKTDGQQLLVKSPYIYENKFIATGDNIELVDAKNFILKERTGRIVKIEEKRISLLEIEQRLNSSPLVSNCHTIILEGHRQIIGVVVVLTSAGKLRLAAMGKRDFNNILREYLLQYFESVVIPRKWRYVDEITTNSQGKILHSEIEKLFI
jgi:acyl-coenzyme A synthetase/AMP-(fatty) acid ligase